MTTLNFADTHNLVAFLSKPAESEGFEQRVDFMNANPIRYALTINPTVYTSCIKQLWANVKAKTVNGEVQLQALVDGKKIIVTEASVRSDLQLDDKEGMDCLLNVTIFEELTRIGTKTTAWNEFSSTMASAIICLATNQKFNFSKYIFESSANPTDPYHTPTIIQPSTSQPQRKQRPRKLKRKHTKVPQPSGPTTNVADEAVNKEMDDSLVRVATTATSLDAEHDRGNINKTQSKATPNKPSSLGTSLGGGPRRQDTMWILLLKLEHKDCSSSGDYKFETKMSKKLEKKGRSRTHKLKRLYKVGRSARMVSSDEASLGNQEDASKQGRKIDDIDKDVEITLVDETQRRYDDDLMFDTGVLDDEEVFAGQDMAEKEINVTEKVVSTADPVTIAGKVVTTASVEVSTASPTEATIADDLTLAQTLIEIRSAKPKVKGVVIGEQSEYTIRTRPQQLPLKDKGKCIMEEPKKLTKRKDQIRHDEEVVQRLQAQMQAELE
ncbi:hypothetical protein Tco_1456249, partial [Tanacetum coccineum]